MAEQTINNPQAPDMPHDPLRGQRPDDRAELTSQRVVETAGKLTREDIAKIEIGHTTISRTMAWALVLVFMGTIFIEPIVQHVHEIGRNFQQWRSANPGPGVLEAMRGSDFWNSILPDAYGIFASLPKAAHAAVVNNGALGTAMFYVVAAVSIFTGLLVIVLFKRLMSGIVMAIPGLAMLVLVAQGPMLLTMLAGAVVAVAAAMLAMMRFGRPVVGGVLVVAGLAMAGYVVAHGNSLDLMAANLTLARDINDYENNKLKKGSLLGGLVLSPTQRLLVAAGAGNEQGYCGRDGWLFYRPEIDYVTQAGFLEPAQLAKRADSRKDWEQPIQSDPRTAILDFRDKLAKRGIELVIMPVPAKSMIHPEQFGGCYNGDAPLLQNSSYAAFKTQIEQAGVAVYDIAPMLLAAKREGNPHPEPQYLQTDTHWTPQAMEMAARGLRDLIESRKLLGPQGQTQYRRHEKQVSNLGDIAVMLKLPADQTVYAKQEVTIHPVVDAEGKSWQPQSDAEVLLLGDSYANIYSLGDMGWGESAGLAEQLSYCLQRPVDCIARNDSGAFKTREILQLELARGNDVLAGKKVVVWEFAVRELAIGNWKLLDLPEALARAAVPAQAGKLVVEGEIAQVSLPRDPNTIYPDYLRWLHVRNLKVLDGQWNQQDAVVYVWSIRQGKEVTGYHLKPGDRVRLTLKPWSQVASTVGRINQAAVDDEELELQVPWWAEELEKK